jgi:type VI secretion system protein ImpC
VPAGLAAAAERRITEGLRSILCARAFRSLEASWRGLDGLVRHCPDEELVRYSALDASVAELVLDLAGLTQLLERGGFEVLVLDHGFRPVASDLSALARLFEVCTARGVSLVAGADATLAGCPRFDQHPDPDTWSESWPEPERALWEALGRVRAAGGKLSLALPRFLLRQPYGAEGEPLEALAFEEMLDTEDHDAFAWGNGVYLLTRALAESRAGAGGRVYADGSVDIRELPVVRVERHGELQIEPCAEVWLSERALGRLRAAGFSVLQGLRDSDRVRVHL